MQSMIRQGVFALLALPLAGGRALTPHGINIESLAGVENMPAAVQAAASGSSNTQLGSVAGALTNLLKHGAGAEGSNNSAVVSTILEIVNVTMRGRLLTAHKHSVDKITAAANEYETCLATYKAADKVRFPKVSLLQGDSWEKDEIEDFFQAYTWCKNYEENVTSGIIQCEYTCQNETVYDCKPIIADTCSKLDCAPVSNEGYRAYLERMLSSLEKRLDDMENYTYHADKSEKCKKLPEFVHKCYENCNGQKKEIAPKNETMPGACCAPRASAETETCNVLKSRRVAWEDYDSCYDAAATNWDTVKTEHEAEGVSRMAQMRSVLRMTCLISSFGPDQKTKLKECMEKSYVKDPAVLAMQIDAGEVVTYHDKLDMFTCNASEVPGTDEFDAIHYKDLPKGIAACPAVTCEDACGLADTSKKFQEVEVCVALEAWQSTPIDTAMGWSKMGTAYALGADVTCDSKFFWNVGSGSCQYAKCPDNALRNIEDTAPNVSSPTKGPGLCPCKTKMQRRIQEAATRSASTKTSTCFAPLNAGDAVYWDLGASQPLGKVNATVSHGTSEIEVFISDNGPGNALSSSESCGKITADRVADCVSHSGGRFLALKGATSGSCLLGDCKPSWCEMTVEGSSMTQEPMKTTGNKYMGQVVTTA
ncbi:unnamed protein product [Symbiodinium pilosum]|uniref:Secreted protein n=1 Tax=Symbiodinium pilosum TaxID=2952 RepID=A0A812S690_SYMPI|nr:unnamed protein product [Symbiodinium pilosum]